MKISKWGNSLAIRLPADVAEHLGFSEGDQVRIDAMDGKLVVEREKSLEELLEAVREIRRKNPIPADYKFTRADAYDNDKF